MLWNEEYRFFKKTLEIATPEQLFYLTEDRKNLAYWQRTIKGSYQIIPIVAIPVAMFLHEEFLVPGGISLTGFHACSVKKPIVPSTSLV